MLKISALVTLVAFAVALGQFGWGPSNFQFGW